MQRVLAILVITLLAAGCRRSPADSSSPEFSTVNARVKWATDQITGSPPSKILDAQFRSLKVDTPSGHMGPGYTTFYMWTRLTIDPTDAPKWAARTKYKSKPGSNPFISSKGGAWTATQAEYDTADWYDPAPIFGKTGGGGYLAITKDGSTVLTYQIDR